jgi:hypothetical protein
MRSRRDFIEDCAHKEAHIRAPRQLAAEAELAELRPQSRAASRLPFVAQLLASVKVAAPASAEEELEDVIA